MASGMYSLPPRLPSGEIRKWRGGVPFGSGRGFTLIELLVVISILGVLVALLLPAVQSVREAARRTQCQDHLHNLVVGLHDYESAHKLLPPGSIAQGTSFQVHSGWGWGAMLLPFVEQSPLHGQIDFETGSAVGANQALLSTPIELWRCPASIAPVHIIVVESGRADVTLATGNYPACEGVMHSMTGVRFADVTDGLSGTLFVGENRFQEGVFGLPSFTSTWCGKVGYIDDYAPNAIPHMGVAELTRINRSPDFAGAFGSQHPGGAQFVFGDGKVDFLSENLNLELFIALGTPAGGEPTTR